MNDDDPSPLDALWQLADGIAYFLEEAPDELIPVTDWAEEAGTEFILDEIAASAEVHDIVHDCESAAASGGLALRIAALSLLYGLARRQGEHPGDNAAFRGAVDAVPWHTVTELQRLRWELATASLARAWDRSGFLLLRFFEEASVDSAQRLLLEAEHELLRMMSEADRGSNKMIPWAAWLPDIGPKPQDPLPGILQRSALMDPAFRWAAPPTLPEEAREALRRAGEHLERATKRGAKLTQPHRTALAFAQLTTGRYKEAAENFEALARSGSIYPPELEWPTRCLWLFTAEAAERVDAARAERILMEYLRRYPDSKRIRLRLAALKLAQLDPAGALQWIRAEADQDPEFDQDPRTSVALMLGTLGVQQKTITDEMRRELATAAAAKGFDCAVRAHWPGFIALTTEEREGWLASAWVLWGTTGAAPAAELASMAVGGLARVMESVVRRCLVIPFRESLGPTAKIGNLLSGLPMRTAEVVGKLLKNPRKVTLGEFAALVGEASPGGPEFLRRLSAWVRRGCDDPDKLRKCLTSATALRNDVAHEVGGLSADEAERRYRDILTTIDVVLAVKRKEAR